MNESITQQQNDLQLHDRRAPDLRRNAKFWIPAVMLVVLFRMYVVGNDGIVLLVHDSKQYAEATTSYFANNSFTRLPSHRPGLPMVAWCVAQIGVPYKLFLDGLLAVVSIAAGLTLARLTYSSVIGFLAFAALMLHPWFMLHSQKFMTEPLVGILMLAQLLLAVPLICQSAAQWKVWIIALAALVSSIYVLSRNETLLVAFFWCSVFLVVLIRHRTQFGRGFLFQRSSWRLILVVIPLLTAWLTIQVISRSHGARFGVASVCVTEANGFVALMNALYSIPPEEKIRFSPVTRQTLALACDASPTLAKYRNILIDPNRPAYKNAAFNLGLKDEVGTWLNWHLSYCFGGLSEKSNNEMMTAAREIRQAQKDGSLDRRFARYPIDPIWREWSPELPGQILIGLRRSFLRQTTLENMQFVRNRPKSSVEKGLFDDALLRRGGVGSDRVFRVFGESKVDDSRCNAAQISTSSGEVLVIVPFIDSSDGKKRFSVSIDDIENPRVDETLTIRLIDLSDQRVVSSAISLESDRRYWPEFAFKGTADDSKESWQIATTRYAADTGPRSLTKNRLNHWYWFLLAGIMLLTFVFGIRNTLNRRRVCDMAWIAAVGLCFVLARCFFYSLIKVWLGWNLVRYIEPNVLIAVFSSICTVIVVGSVVGSRFARRTATDSTTDSSAAHHSG